MDLSLLNTADSSEEGAWLEVLALDWETPVGCSILVLGPDSKEAMRISDEEEKFQQRRLAEAFAGAAKKGKTEAEDEDTVEKAIRKAAKLTKSWKDIEWEGKTFPYSAENAHFLYAKVPHIRQQVLNFYRDRANFTKPEYANWRKRFGEGSISTSPEKTESPSARRSNK